MKLFLLVAAIISSLIATSVGLTFCMGMGAKPGYDAGAAFAPTVFVLLT